jgi:hypothetical protein
MNMPGFTAEISLYQTNVQYHAAHQREHASGIVHPAQFAIFTPFDPSLPTSLFRPVPPWYTDVFEPFCRVERTEFYDFEKMKVIALCEKVCSDGSRMPMPCEDSASGVRSFLIP